MASKEESRAILQEALKMEKSAEDNCESLLHEARLNGFHDAVEHIKNDEIHHQTMVKKLLGFLA